jgi:RNA polymerase sigma factor (sigma-70 family)
MTRLLERARTSRQRTESVLRSVAGTDPVLGLLEQLAVYERTPSQSAAAHETMAAVQRALRRLTADHATVIRLRYVDRLSAIDAAGRLDRSPAAVDKLLQRAMAALRVELRSLIAAHG